MNTDVSRDQFTKAMKELYGAREMDMRDQRRILRIQRRNSLYAVAFWSGTLKIHQWCRYEGKHIPVLSVETER